MEKTKQQAKEAVTQRVYYWEYDDGSVAALQFNSGCKKATAVQYFSNLQKMRSFYGSGSQRKANAVELKKRKLHVGIGEDKKRLFSSSNTDIEAMREGFTELKKMINIYSLPDDNSEVMNLFSLAMAGYISRPLLSKIEDRPLYFHRAPVVHVIGHKQDVCAGFEHLERIIMSLSVDTSWDGKQIIHIPAVIPTKCPVDNITDCAYFRMKRDEQKTRCEAQYRDTLVLVHPHFFEDAQMKRFIQRNAWASIFVFNEKWIVPVR